ncbi:hypothetical protein DYQ86_16720 [Acidobacteria bacterium AB60]|nr:hypothetical protein DYQ86_16720 [Acidobacteria bacterium AB60]
MSTTSAHAAQFGVYVQSGPAAYVPPCPGPGYVWAAGYWNDGYWIPGRWNFVGVRRDFDRDDYPRVYYRDHDRDWDRHRDWDRDRDWDRHRDWDRDRDRRWDRDGDRHWDRDRDHDRR